MASVEIGLGEESVEGFLVTLAMGLAKGKRLTVADATILDKLAIMLISFSDGLVSMFATSCMVFAMGAVAQGIGCVCLADLICRRMMGIDSVASA